MAATVPNPPSLNADLCIQQIVRHFKSQKFKRYLQITPLDVLTKANIDKAIPWNTEAYMKGRAANKFDWDLAVLRKGVQEEQEDVRGFRLPRGSVHGEPLGPERRDLIFRGLAEPAGLRLSRAAFNRTGSAPFLHR